MLRVAVAALLSFFLLLPAVAAQFQFFGDFFGQQGQQQGQQERQNVASDSKWYRQTWENGKHSRASPSMQLMFAGFSTSLAELVWKSGRLTCSP